MDVIKICKQGYFDRLIVDGYMMPLYNSRGVEIKLNNASLIESIENSNNPFNNGLGKLRINIIGEALNKDTYEEIAKMQEHRETELGLERIKLGVIDRYIIGYVDILILKSDYSLPNNITNKGNTIHELEQTVRDGDLELIKKACKIQEKLKKETLDCNIAIIDKLYIHYEFRRCGISSWIHSNIKDIIKLYGMINIGAVLLIPGDFSNESETKFNMTREEYEKMLIKHYKDVGYKVVKDNIMINSIIKPSIINKFNNK